MLALAGTSAMDTKQATSMGLDAGTRPSRTAITPITSSTVIFTIRMAATATTTGLLRTPSSNWLVYALALR